MPTLRDALQSALAGTYVLERELGAGGMATVFLAQDLKHGREVALKVLRPDVTGGVNAERFLREVRVTAQLQHPHILPVFDSGQSGAYLWYTMPYVAGETLRDRIAREHQFTVQDAAQVMHDITSALAYAHARGVVHRDIKPENILLTPQHMALVADFGIATALEPDEHVLTATGFGVGTPGYMAPEQMLGERPIRPPADVYALGVMLHEMLAGTRPFPDGAPVVDLAKRMADGAPSLVTARRDVAPALAALVQQALEVDPARRPADAGVFGTLFENATKVRDTPPQPAPRASRRSVRAAIGLGALAVAGVIAWLVWKPHAPVVTATDVTVAVLPFTTGVADSANPYLGDGLAEDLTGRLARVRGLRLTPVTSSLRFRNTTHAPEDVAAMLGATHVVLGRVVWNGDLARVSVELVDAARRAQVWSDVRSVPRRDLAGVVASFSHTIAGALAPGAANAATEDFVSRDSQAYNYHLLGQHYFKTFTPQGLARSVAYQDSAIARDPGLVAAWNGRANALIAMASANGALTGREALGPLREALDTVLAMDPGNGLAHATRGHTYTWFEWDWKAARREFNQALSLSPDEPLVLLRASFLEMVLGHTDSALTLLASARRMDPTNTRFVLATATAQYFGRRYQDCLTFARRGGELDPLFPPARQYEFLALSALGRHAEAIAKARAAWIETRQPLMLSTLAIALAQGDSLDAARATLRELVTLSQTTPLDAGMLYRPYALLGDRAQFQLWLDRAINQRSFQVSFLNVDPLVDGMRTDAAFGEALARAGVPAPEGRAPR